MPERTAEQIQHEIEQARDALASAIDQLANPKRLADGAKQSLQAKAQTPTGKGVLGGVVVVVGLLVFRRIRRGHGSDELVGSLSRHSAIKGVQAARRLEAQSCRPLSLQAERTTR